MSIDCESDITTAANRILRDLGPQVVIIKGGHIGEDATDYAFTKDGSIRTWTSPKYDTVHTHGTGCTFSAVITAELAKGRDVMDAIGIAKDYIALAIKYNPGWEMAVVPLIIWLMASYLMDLKRWMSS